MVLLLNMVTRFANGAAAHFPIRKIILLIWKTVLLTQGGIEELYKRRVSLRDTAGLRGFAEDTHAVCRSMRSASPPPSAAEQLDPLHGGMSRRSAALGGQNQPGGLASGVLLRKSNLTKQSSLLDESALAYADDADASGGSVQSAMETDANDVIERGSRPARPANSDADDVFTRPADDADSQPDGRAAEDGARRNEASKREFDPPLGDPAPLDSLNLSDNGQPGTRERLRGATDSESGSLSTSEAHWISPAEIQKERRLPWRPKVRRKDLEAFVEVTRDKFAGLRCTPHADVHSLAGLPLPIHESVRVLQQHVYVSLADLQVQREEEMARFPLSRAESPDDTALNASEQLYRGVLPNISQFVVRSLSFCYYTQVLRLYFTVSLSFSVKILRISTKFQVGPSLRNVST